METGMPDMEGGGSKMGGGLWVRGKGWGRGGDGRERREEGPWGV